MARNYMDKIIALIFSPAFLIFIFGVLLLWRTEGIKTQIERQSHFVKKWADRFFDTCHEFMNGIEHIMALLNQLKLLDNPNDERVVRYKQEYSDCFQIVTELELKIRRMVSFSPRYGETVKKKAFDILAMLSNISRQGQVNFDRLFVLVVEFNAAAKSAHNEMLTIKE